MKNKLLITFILVLSFFTFTGPVYAADASVTCDSDGCNISGDDPLFDEDNIYPGWSIIKTLKAKNEYGEDREFMVEVDNLDVDSNFPLTDVLKIEIREDGETDNIYGPEDLEDWEDEKDLPLGYIAESDSTTYEFIITMDPSAGNEYQGKSTSFDLKLGFDTEPVVEGASTSSYEQALGIGGQLFGFGQIQGEATEEESPTEIPVVEGVRDEVEDVCKDPWWWFLVFLVQMLLHLLFMFAIKKEKRNFKVTLQILTGLGFMYIFWKNFCPTWDVYAAGIIGIFFTTISYRIKE